jgi:hypothetical protein
MPKRKNIKIDYTARDFDSIKEKLVEHAQRYYPDNYKDFSTPSFGSMILDTVAYVGDVLSYYVDYSANESFLDSSIEYDNVRRHAKSMGYNHKGIPSSYGVVSLFIIVPSNVDGTAPDTNYLPILKIGTAFSSFSGGNFILTEDVDFADPKNETVAARFDPTSGATTHFAVRAHGQVESGLLQIAKADLRNQNFQRFKKVRVGGPEVTEIMNVVDSEGNIYYQVENLSQEVVFVETTNKEASRQGVRSILKPFAVSRRFTVETDELGTFLQFGFGSDEEEVNGIVDPSRVALKMHGKNYISSENFDPSLLIQTNKLGISPSDTVLKITYRINQFDKINVASNTIRTVSNKRMEFRDPFLLTKTKATEVISSLEVNNDKPLYSTNSDITLEELKQRVKANFATQSRAVTIKDYESLTYNMPPKFGSIKRVSVINSQMEERKLKMYVISEDPESHLINTDVKTKENIKNWLTKYKSINDRVEIFDAKILNFSIDYIAVSDKRFSSNDVLNSSILKLKEYFSEAFYIGEPLYINRIYDVLNKMDGIVDVKSVKISLKTGGNYSSTSLSLNEIISKDGTFYNVPKNCIFELKYANNDIKGTII